jgi:hypothetical protein
MLCDGHMLCRVALNTTPFLEAPMKIHYAPLLEEVRDPVTELRAQEPEYKPLP